MWQQQYLHLRLEKPCLTEETELKYKWIFTWHDVINGEDEKLVLYSLKRDFHPCVSKECDGFIILATRIKELI